MNKKRNLFFAVFFICTLVFAQTDNGIPEKLEIPYCAGVHAREKAEDVADHELRELFAFSLCYREHYEQAEWAAYVLTWRELENPAKRKDNFRADPKISSGSAELGDYKKSGFDRGHLVPAADMAFSELAMSESFFLSNITPQRAQFNRGVWVKLETQTRTWAKKFGTLWIVTGAILEKSQYETIGKNKVAVPEYYYKIILTRVKNQWQAIGFVIPNAAQSEHLFTFAIPIRDIEARTGINFFYQLPQDVQDALETSVTLSNWR